MSGPILLGILALGSCVLAPLRLLGRDSLRVVVRDSAIVVTAKSWLADETISGPSRSTVDRTVIDRLAPVTMSSILPLFPGVFVKDYGGIGGMQMISLRGGSSAQALVLLDGARMSSAQHGSIDLSSIPTRFVESVTVTRGGASALYGANALTGAVDVRMRLHDSTGVAATLAHGAFNEWRSALGGVAVFGDDIRVGLDVDLYGTRGSFPFVTSQFGSAITVNRENGDARYRRLIGRVEVGSNASVSIIGRSADRGVPGGVVQGAITQARARLVDDDVLGILRFGVGRAAGGELSVHASARVMRQHYADPDATIVGTQGIDVTYHQRDANISMLWNTVTPDLSATLRIDGSYADVRGATIMAGEENLASRQSVSLAADVILPTAIVPDVELRAAMRTDVFSDVGVAVSPMLALRWKVLSELSLRTSLGLSFRPPTFNELYYLNYGTQSLRPERGSTVEMGVAYQPYAWCTFDASLYTGTIRDLIVAVPVSPVITSAQNVGRALSRGGEVLARVQALDGRLIGQWSYALQFMTDATGRAGLDGTLVAYAVPELASVLLQWDQAAWFATAQWSMTSYRHALPGAQYSSMLAPFALTSLNVGLRMRGRLMRGTVIAQCDNLMDVSYQIVRGYPMPGRSIRVTTSLEVR